MGEQVCHGRFSRRLHSDNKPGPFSHSISIANGAGRRCTESTCPKYGGASTRLRDEQGLPRVVAGKQASKPTLPPWSETRDHLSGVSIVLRPVVLALEEELEFGSEIRDSSLTTQDGILPGHPECRIPSIDPALIVAFADRDVEAPWLVRLLTAPHVVLVSLGGECRPVPWSEGASCSDLDVPAAKHHRQGSARHPSGCSHRRHGEDATSARGAAPGPLHR